MPDPIDTELVLAFMDVDAAKVATTEANRRANAAVTAARDAGRSVASIARTVKRDRTTIQKRAGARLTEQDNER